MPSTSLITLYSIVAFGGYATAASACTAGGVSSGLDAFPSKSCNTSAVHY